MSDPNVIVLPKDPAHEFARVMTRATVEKRSEKYELRLNELIRAGMEPGAAERQAKEDVPPYEVIEGDYNAFVDDGIINCLNLLIGGGGTALNNTNARLGVGDSATAWATNQTDLQAAANKLRKAMNATYPLGTGTKTITFRSDFTASEAVWQWNEWGIFWAASGTSMLSRKVETFGTKANGPTWTLTATFTVA